MPNATRCPAASRTSVLTQEQVEAIQGTGRQLQCLLIQPMTRAGMTTTGAVTTALSPVNRVCELLWWWWYSCPMLTISLTRHTCRKQDYLTHEDVKMCLPITPSITYKRILAKGVRNAMIQSHSTTPQHFISIQTHFPGANNRATQRYKAMGKWHRRWRVGGWGDYVAMSLSSNGVVCHLYRLVDALHCTL